MAKVTRWTETQKDKLAGLYNRGLSMSEIGARMGFSRCAVIGVVDRMMKAGDTRLERSAGHNAGSNKYRAGSFSGLSKWTDEQSLEILSLRERFSKGWDEIGRRIGRTGAACAQHYHEIIRDLNASEAA